jgi:hypothetical protein
VSAASSFLVLVIRYEFLFLPLDQAPQHLRSHLVAGQGAVYRIAGDSVAFAEVIEERGQRGINVSLVRAGCYRAVLS